MVIVVDLVKQLKTYYPFVTYELLFGKIPVQRRMYTFLMYKGQNMIRVIYSGVFVLKIYLGSCIMCNKATFYTNRSTSNGH